MGIDFPLANSKAEGAHAQSWAIESHLGTLPMSADLFFDHAQFEIK
jgi:hypothetical protein